MKIREPVGPESQVRSKDSGKVGNLPRSSTIISPFVHPFHYTEQARDALEPPQLEGSSRGPQVNSGPQQQET